MLTVACVLRSGGIYDASWVGKLARAVARNIHQAYRFVCLSDVKVDCERIPLPEGWPGWWSKLCLFKPGLLPTPALYMDLDTVVTGPLDAVAALPHKFAMIDLRTPDQTGRGQSGVMWLREPPPIVYERFAENPEHFMRYHEKRANGTYVGDQAFVNDTLGPGLEKITRDLPGFVRSYKLHCRNGLPAGTSIVAFHGSPRPGEVADPWVREAWA